MATNTTKLGLIKPDLTDVVDVGNLNDNADDIDAAVGFTLCTSATRPATPWAGQTIFETDTTSSFVWDGSAWQAAGGGSGSITVSATAPVSPPPANGDLWWDSDNGNMYIYYDDGDSQQWVAANGPQVFVGAAAPAGYQGQMWFDSSTGKMYVFYDDGTSSQWVSAIGGSLAGSVLQVVSTTKTDTFSTTSGTYAQVTDLVVNITPSSTSSKFLVMASVPNSSAGGSSGQQAMLAVYRDSTNLIVPDSPGSRAPAYGTFVRFGDVELEPGSFTILDSPATTSTLSYSVYFKSGGSTAYINRSSADTNSSSYPRGVATITVMEVAG